MEENELKNLIARFSQKAKTGLTPDDAQLLKEVANQRINSKGYHFDFALLFEEAGLFELAYRELNLARRDEPQNPAVMRKVADYLLEKGEIEKASTIFEKLLFLSPKKAEALHWLLELYIMRGDRESVESAIKVAEKTGMGKEEISRILKSVECDIPDEFNFNSTNENRQTKKSMGDGATGGKETAVASPMSISTDPYHGIFPTDEDIIRFLHLFSGREDVYARAWYSHSSGKSGYSPVKEPLTPRIVRLHFLGDLTIGVYCLRLDGTSGFFSFDIDITRRALDKIYTKEDGIRIKGELRRAVRSIAQLLEHLEIDYIIETSGYKGFHVWSFLENPIPAEVVYNFGRYALRLIKSNLPLDISVEFFPKQPARTHKGLSNLIKLPLGIHVKTGKRSMILNKDFTNPENPFRLLQDVKLLNKNELFKAVEKLKARFLINCSTLNQDGVQIKSDSGKNELASVIPISKTGVSKFESKTEGKEEDSEGVEAPFLNEGSTEFRGPSLPPIWCEVDFEHDRYISTLFRSCEVLSDLKKKVDEHGILDYNEVIILQHTLGHIPTGVLCANYLFSRCANLTEDVMLKSVLKGNPISCPKIRSRIPHITSKVNCSCRFPNKNHYPTPLLHLDILSEKKEDSNRKGIAVNEKTPTFRRIEKEELKNITLHDLARKYLRTLSFKARIEKTIEEIQKILWEGLMATSNNSIKVEEGIIKATQTGGVREIEFIPEGKNKQVKKTS